MDSKFVKLVGLRIAKSNSHVGYQKSTRLSVLTADYPPPLQCNNSN